MDKKILHKWIARTHKWVGLILGLQLLAWTAGGVVMTWMPIDEVRGRHNATEQEPVAMGTVGESLLPMSDLMALVGKPITRATYHTLLGKPVVQVSLMDGTTELWHAAEGKRLSPLSETLATDIAVADFAPEAAIVGVNYIEAPVLDFRGPFPAWQVTFSDAENTNIYVSATNGRVVARRTDRWRLFDFFWMLHIMDYDEREDINNPLLITTAGCALVFALSGFFLLFFRFYRRDFNFILGRRKREA
ncbi:MAG: PepSY domain-containing protein [Alphaproteobacteria bacterium]|nr:PepSY domain-containing protein [Alphaproteobacteria bacterium]